MCSSHILLNVSLFNTSSYSILLGLMHGYKLWVIW